MSSNLCLSPCTRAGNNLRIELEFSWIFITRSKPPRRLDALDQRLCRADMCQGKPPEKARLSKSGDDSVTNTRQQIVTTRTFPSVRCVAKVVALPLSRNRRRQP